MDFEKIKATLHDQINNIQLAIKFFILVIFLGYIMIWVMMPTNIFWLDWLPDIHAKSDSTYFGKEGSNILMYSFPILLIATLGCLYLHLEKCNDDFQFKTPKDSHLVSSSRRPLLVRGPLGVVSRIELTFVLMFITLLIWSIAVYVHAMFKNITRQSASKIGEFVWEVKLDSVALMLGLVGNICLGFLFFPVTRGSSILRLVGLTSESSIKYHIWLGHIVLALFIAHGLCYMIFWANTHQISEVMKWNKIGISNVAGEVALLSEITMWITSIPLARRKLFELFFYTHHLYIVFVVFFVFHVGFSYFCITLPGFYLFMVDRCLRFLQSQQRVRLISARVLPCQAMELNFSKDPRLSYSPSSVMFINVKSVSKLQWHPFTVVSNNNMEPDKISIVIKSEGSWSRKLYEMISSPTPLDHLEVSVEGPYGHRSTSFLGHEKLVMVSGGSGITPFISIIRELIFISNTSNRKTPRILLVASFKKSSDVRMLEFLLPSSGTSCDLSRLHLRIQAYVTREKSPTKDSQKPPQTIWFKPSTHYKPVYAVLGPKSWLWLGAIIASSFVVFLLLLGLINRYYIYPIDHNIYLIYSYTARSIISMLLVFVSVATASTLAFLWNKKNNEKEMMQIQNAETPTQVASPIQESWLYEDMRELECFPHQSFSHVTEVNYGERPNIEKILLECEESSVGVLVSGPKKMRQDISAICSSDLGKRLHYQSFSFSW